LHDYAEKTTLLIFTKFGGKLTTEDPLDFDGNPDHVMLGLG